MGGKTAWLSRHLPSRSDVATWHQPVSYVVACLTGASVISPSLASTTMLYDLAEDDWADDLAALFGARHGQLPRIAPEASAAGTLTRAGAALTGLPAAMPVAVGTGDDFTNLIGSGISEPGIAAVSLGTAEALGAVAERPHLDPAMLVETRRFPGVAYHIGNPGWLSGGAVRWAAGLLGVDEEAFNTLAASAPPGSDGLVFIPALAGAMTPKWIAGARGSFVGLTPSHGRGHMARAVLEGVAFAMRDVIDRLDALGSTIARARLIGGGARSALWCQIRADLIGRPIEALTESDASAVGAAVLAHVLAGRDPDIGSATRALPLNLTTYEPNRAHRGPYDAAYARYREHRTQRCGRIGGARGDRPSGADRLDEASDHQQMAVGLLDRDFAPGLLGLEVEPQRSAAERVGHVEPSERAVDLDGLLVSGAGTVCIGGYRNEPAIAEAERCAHRVLDLGGRGEGRNGTARMGVVEAGDIAQRIELMDGVHQQHPAARLAEPRPPNRRAGRTVIAVALVDDGADAHEARRADCPRCNQPARVLDAAGPAKLEEHRELEPLLIGQRPQTPRTGNGKAQRLFGQHMLAGHERTFDSRREEVMRQPDIDGVHLRMIEQTLEAWDDSGARFRRQRFGPAAVGVERCNNAQSIDPGRRTHDLARRPATADDPQSDLLAHGSNPSGSGTPIRWDSES
jgi:xylulokinase